MRLSLRASNARRPAAAAVAGMRSRPQAVRSASVQESRRGRVAAGASPQPTVPEVYTNSPDPEVLAFQAHQKTAARLSPVDEARTMMDIGRFGLLSTLSVREDGQGFPNGNVVEYATDERGCPVFAVSTLSTHCADLTEDGRASLTVLGTNFESIGDSRYTLQGSVRPVKDSEEKDALRERFLAKYPDAFYVDFADFKWFIMDEIKGSRYFGGFGTAKKISAEDYLAATPDPVAKFSKPVCGHMNEDHIEDMQAVISQVVGLTTESAQMTDLDSLGINFMVKHKGQSFKLRLPFPEPAPDRKSIKDRIVTMVRDAKTKSE